MQWGMCERLIQESGFGQIVHVEASAARLRSMLHRAGMSVIWVAVLHPNVHRGPRGAVLEGKPDRGSLAQTCIITLLLIRFASTR